MLEISLFRAHLNETFQVHAGDEIVLSMTLIEVKPLPAPAPSTNPWDSEAAIELRREPFSLIFRGPWDQPLPQRTYRLEHEKLGVIENLFLVPVGMNQDGNYYESVVN